MKTRVDHRKISSLAILCLTISCAAGVMYDAFSYRETADDLDDSPPWETAWRDDSGAREKLADEVCEWVIDKTQDEIVRTLGEPDRTTIGSASIDSKAGDSVVTWKYTIGMNESGFLVTTLQIHIRNGHAIKADVQYFQALLRAY